MKTNLNNPLGFPSHDELLQEFQSATTDKEGSVPFEERMNERLRIAKADLDVSKCYCPPKPSPTP